MKKQTTVEWLIQQLGESGVQYLDLASDIIEKAIEMEKQQIETAFAQGEMFNDNYFDPNNPNVSCSENYFNETYGKLFKKI